MSPIANPLRVAAAPVLPSWAVALGSAFGLVVGGWPAALGVSLVAALFALIGPRSAGAVDRPAAPQRAQLGQYVLGEKLGEGGMGVVFKGQHPLLERPVAIKLLPAKHASPANIERFEREAELTRRASHPNTIAVYDAGRTREGLPYYAMEYVDGLDLQSLVEQQGPLEPARVAHVLAQLAGALGEVHAAGLIHRDVKPANVMLCERGGERDVVKMLDFGLSVAQGERSIEAGQLAGTPLYLPPESITAPESLEARSDLYSLGALGYFLLTGATPFQGRNLAELCGHHVHSAPLAPSARLGAPLPAQLEALILACLAKSPAQRPASAEALRAALLPLAASGTRDERAGGRRTAAGGGHPVAGGGHVGLRLLPRREDSGVECFLPTVVAA